MSSNVTMTVYLGASEEGRKNERLILVEAARRQMTKSEFALWCIKEYIAQDAKARQTS